MSESIATAPLPTRGAGAAIGRHLLAFTLPLVTLGYLVTGPHVWWVTLLWLLPGFAIEQLDWRSRPERRQPDPALPAWPFEAMLYGLAALQVVNVALLVVMISRAGFGSLDFVVGWMIVAGSSGWSGIVVAHELIHRRGRLQRWLGRGLMALVLYEHFTTEHLRGHHARVGTGDDPATARYDETFARFLARTVPGQFRSAWRLEAARLGDVGMALLDRRQLGNRVLHGLAAEGVLLLGIALGFGAAALIAFALQGAAAVVLLEAVNYFEHWGLSRHSKRVRPVDSWDTESWFTYYALVGLSRHADHHAYASRPYPQLRLFEESPKLPTGYIGMVNLAIFRNRHCRALLRQELERRGLGPFEPAVPS